MKLFATRVWGNPVGGRMPMATFGSEGHMSRLLRLAKAGDRLVFVGTRGDRTEEHNQGRILSMAEFGFLRMKTLDYFDKSELDPRDFDIRGNFKFPFGVPIVRGWDFTPMPLVTELKQRLTMLATPGVEELTDPVDHAWLLSLPSTEVALPDIPIIEKMRRLNDHLKLKPTKGPTPSDSTYTIERSAMQQSWTYAFQYGKHSLYKVGHTTNVPERLKAVNQHIPIEIGIAPWTAIFQEEWPDALTAYAMEQKVFELLDAKRTGFERVACSHKELWAAWQQAIIGD